MLVTWIIPSLALLSTTILPSCLATPFSTPPHSIQPIELQKRRAGNNGILNSCTVTYKGVFQTVWMDFNNTSDNPQGMKAQQGADQVLSWMRRVVGPVTGWTVKDDGHGGLQAWGSISLQGNDAQLQYALDNAGVSRADHDCTGIPWNTQIRR